MPHATVLGVITTSLILIAAGLLLVALPEVMEALPYRRVGVEEDVSVVDQRLDALKVLFVGIGRVHILQLCVHGDSMSKFRLHSLLAVRTQLAGDSESALIPLFAGLSQTVFALL